MQMHRVAHPASDRISKVASVFKGDLSALARMPHSGSSTDFAIRLCTSKIAVVRCSERITNSDHTELATMLAQNECTWAALVYAEPTGSAAFGFIESFHVSELNRLIETLLKLREIFSESR